MVWPVLVPGIRIGLVWLAEDASERTTVELHKRLMKVEKSLLPLNTLDRMTKCLYIFLVNRVLGHSAGV